MNKTTLKASLLATAIALATSAPIALAHDHEGTPERSVGQTVEAAPEMRNAVNGVLVAEGAEELAL